MNLITSLSEIKDLAKALHDQKKDIVLVGGCFDILHLGHVRFLEEAKKIGDMLIVFIESDETIRKSKGENRPIHTQKDRATVVSSLTSVDFTILLPPLCKDEDYGDIIRTLQPRVIATTQGDPYRSHKERHARETGAEVLDVIDRLPEFSSTRLSQIA